MVVTATATSAKGLPAGAIFFFRCFGAFQTSLRSWFFSPANLKNFQSRQASWPGLKNFQVSWTETPNSQAGLKTPQNTKKVCLDVVLWKFTECGSFCCLFRYDRYARNHWPEKRQPLTRKKTADPKKDSHWPTFCNFHNHVQNILFCTSFLYFFFVTLGGKWVGRIPKTRTKLGVA